MRRLTRILGRKRRTDAILELTPADFWRPSAGREGSAADLKRIASEVEAVGDYVTRLRKEIARLQLNRTLMRSIPNCRNDLSGAQSATEEATHTIMSASEAVLGSTQTDLDAYRVEVEAALLEILQACSFQDLTGQRLVRAMEAIAQIERRLQRFAKNVRISDTADTFDRQAIVQEARRETLLVEGPQDFGKAIHQSDIDKLFS